jgi:hypothetical protein
MEEEEEEGRGKKRRRRVLSFAFQPLWKRVKFFVPTENLATILRSSSLLPCI